MLFLNNLPCKKLLVVYITYICYDSACTLLNLRKGEKEMRKLKIFILSIVLGILFSTTGYAASYEMHTVNEGESYWKISDAYNISVGSLLQINNAVNHTLNAGNLIKVKPLKKTISIFVNGNKLILDVQPYIENRRTHVPIRFISEALSAEVSWNSQTQAAVIRSGGKTITLPIGSSTAYVNGTPHQLDAEIQLYQGRTFIPVRFVSEVLGCTVQWNGSTYSVIINSATNKTLKTATATYTQDDLYWLSRIVESEATGESYAGKLAVANVIINRKNHKEFPNTIKGVIFDGEQFTPVANGTIYNTPTQESINAAKEALEGHNNISSCLFFLNPKKSISTWIQKNRTFYKSVGNHDFYM